MKRCLWHSFVDLPRVFVQGRRYLFLPRRYPVLLQRWLVLQALVRLAQRLSVELVLGLYRLHPLVAEVVHVSEMIQSAVKRILRASYSQVVCGSPVHQLLELALAIAALVRRSVDALLFVVSEGVAVAFADLGLLKCVQESWLEVVRVLGLPRLLLHHLLHILALVLTTRDVGAADSRGALAVGFVIRIALVLRVAVVVVLDSLVRRGLLFLLASDVERTRRVIMTRILGLLAVLLISGLLEIAVVEAGLIVLCLRLVREVLAVARGHVRSLVGFVLVVLRLDIILQLFAKVLESADQLLGVVVDRLDISVAGRRVGFAPRLVEFVLFVALRYSLVFGRGLNVVRLGVFIRMVIWNRASDRLVLQGGSVAVEGRQVYVPTIFDVMLAHVFLFDHLDQLHIVNIAVTPVGHLPRPRFHRIAASIGHSRIVLIFGNDAGDLSLFQRIVSLVACDRFVLH